MNVNVFEDVFGEEIIEYLQDGKEQNTNGGSIETVMENTKIEVQNKNLKEIIVCAYPKNGTTMRIPYNDQNNDTMISSDQYPWNRKDPHESNRDVRRPRRDLDNLRAPPVGDVMEYNPGSRSAFVQLVLGIVFIMLLVTAAFNVCVALVPEMRNIFSQAAFSIIPGTIISLVVYYGFMCYSYTRTLPCNVIFLCLSVIGTSLVTCYLTSHFQTHIVGIALVATAVAVFVCFLLAFSSFDFTRYYLYVIVAAVGLSIVSFIVLILWLTLRIRYKPLQLVILIASTLLQCAFLVMELQMILGGRSIELGEHEYAYGAFLLFNSIIDMFIKFMLMFNIIDNLFN